MVNIFEKIMEEVNQGNDIVLVSVIESTGSTPRSEGALMIVKEDGIAFGTIGGGMLEHYGDVYGREILKSKRCEMKEFALHPGDRDELGMICGGNVTLYFLYIKGNDKDIINLCMMALNKKSEDKEVYMVTELKNGVDGILGIYTKDDGFIVDGLEDINSELIGSHTKIKLNDKQYYAQKIFTSEKVYIFGGGHVAQKLVPVLSYVGFSCIVLEERPEFAKKELFPDASMVKLIDFKDISDMKNIGANDYVVIMTRGHASDYEVEVQALKTPAKYIGVIGSRIKAAASKKNLEEDGFSKDDIQRIICPLGIMGIGAETPQEIAISIAGQMIAVRAGKGIVS